MRSPKDVTIISMRVLSKGGYLLSSLAVRDLVDIRPEGANEGAERMRHASVPHPHPKHKGVDAPEGSRNSRSASSEPPSRVSWRRGSIVIALIKLAQLL